MRKLLVVAVLGVLVGAAVAYAADEVSWGDVKGVTQVHPSAKAAVTPIQFQLVDDGTGVGGEDIRVWDTKKTGGIILQRKSEMTWHIVSYDWVDSTPPTKPGEYPDPDAEDIIGKLTMTQVNVTLKGADPGYDNEGNPILVPYPEDWSGFGSRESFHFLLELYAGNGLVGSRYGSFEGRAQGGIGGLQRDGSWVGEVGTWVGQGSGGFEGMKLDVSFDGVMISGFVLAPRGF